MTVSVLRTPQTVTALGLAGLYEMPNSALDSFVQADLLLTQSFEDELLARANAYDLGSLPENVRFDLRVFIWMLEDRVAQHPYQWLAFPFLTREGFLTDQYVDLLMVAQPFRDEADVEDYLDRLAAIGPQMDQLVDYLQVQQEQGVRLPYALYTAVMEEMGAHRWKVGRKTPFITVLAVRLQNLESVSKAARQDYYERGSQIADEVILPAFDRLMNTLYAQAEQTTEAIGMSAQPDGLAAYQARLGQSVTLSISPEALHTYGEQEVSRLDVEVRLAAAQAGYDPELPLQEIFRQAKVDRDYALGLDIFVTLHRLLVDVEEAMDGNFEMTIENDLVMVPVFEGGFYEPAALDGSRKAAFYAGFTGQEAHFDMPTRVYHETFPGRHFQDSVVLSSDLPLYRQAIHFPVYDEGWAQYAEYLAWEMGMYADDPHANLGRLQSELLAAARLVVDTGIHALGWDAQEAARYLVDSAGMDRSEANEQVLFQIARPAEAVAGYLGYAFIRDLRKAVQIRQGEEFDLQAFHTALLSGGSLPLPLLEERVWAMVSNVE